MKARIAELQEEVREQTEVTIDVVRLLLDSFRDAKAANQHGLAVRAVGLLGKRFGMFCDRLKVFEVQAMTDEELAAGLARQGAGVPCPNRKNRETVHPEDKNRDEPRKPRR